MLNLTKSLITGIMKKSQAPSKAKEVATTRSNSASEVQASNKVTNAIINEKNLATPGYSQPSDVVVVNSGNRRSPRLVEAIENSTDIVTLNSIGTEAQTQLFNEVELEFINNLEDVDSDLDFSVTLMDKNNKKRKGNIE